MSAWRAAYLPLLRGKAWHVLQFGRPAGVCVAIGLGSRAKLFKTEVSEKRLFVAGRPAL